MTKYEVIVYECGTRHWYLNGKRHREYGPALECDNGVRSWWLNGKRHREDGPAIEWDDGRREWWLNGKEVTEQEVMKSAKEMTVAEIEKLLGIKLRL
jgi:hypothetical protein